MGRRADRGPAQDTSFGAELRKLRLAQGTSQAALSRAVHYSNAYLCKVENGQKPPTADLARRCDDALGTGGRLMALLAAAPAVRRRGGRRVLPTPAQLPADIPDFTGRDSQLERIEAALGTAAAGAGAIMAITGAAGVGKSALAVHYGHSMKRQAADGQLYINMRGISAIAAMRPVEALAQLLRALGVEDEMVPSELDEAAALYRSLVSGRQLLIILDNVASSAQARPLLPGSSSCTVIMTSRDRLTGLAASHGVSRLALDVLSPEESLALLTRLLGAARVSEQEDQAVELAASCARLPLALRIAAAKLAEDPALPIGDYVAAMRSGDRLAALEVVGDEGAGVAAAFSLSYSALEPPARRLFRLLGLAPGPDITAVAAAVLADTTRRQSSALLGVLEAAHMVAQHRPGRFAMHDLLAEYARTLADTREGARSADRARRRLYTFYLESASGAARLISPHSARAAAARPDVASFASAAEAVSWIDAERPNLIDMARQAAVNGPHEVAWLLADSTQPYFWLRRHGPDWLAVTEAGLAAARASGDKGGQASALWRLADAQFSVGRYEEAIAGYREAAALAASHDLPQVQGAALGNLGMLYRERGLLGEAVDCYTRSLVIARASGLTTSVAANLSNLGIACLELGQLERSADYQVRALSMHIEAGSTLRSARTMLNLAMAYHQLGRWDEAERLLLDALPMLREAADPVGEAHARNSLAALLCDRGRSDDAHAEATAALAIARQTPDRTAEVDALNQLGALCLRASQLHEGLALYRQAAALAAQIGHYPEGEAMIGITACCCGLGRADEAAGIIGVAIGLTRDFEFKVLEGHALVEQALLRLRQDAPAEAIEPATAAAAIQAETGHRLGQARALRVLGLALDKSGCADAAARSLAQASDLLVSLGAPDALEQRCAAAASVR